MEEKTIAAQPAAELAAARGGKPRKEVSKRQRRLDRTGWLFMLPALLFGALFLVVPIVMCVAFSFTDFFTPRPESTLFVGFENYIAVFRDSTFYKAVGNTLLFVVITVPVQCLLALGLALLVNRTYRGFGIFKLAYFAPVITSMTVVALLFELFYQQDGGLFNLILSLVGIQPQGFLNDPSQALVCIALMSVWQGAGYQMIIILAGLQGVPKELYEAAELDAAGPWDKFIHITLPGIRSVASFVVVITLVGAFKMFTQSYIMTSGGPADATLTLVYYIYQKGISPEQQAGYASAIATIFTLAFVIASVAKTYLQKLGGKYAKYREKVLGAL